MSEQSLRSRVAHLEKEVEELQAVCRAILLKDSPSKKSFAISLVAHNHSEMEFWSMLNSLASAVQDVNPMAIASIKKVIELGSNNCDQAAAGLAKIGD